MVQQNYSRHGHQEVERENRTGLGTRSNL
jgi:hypothetical protein